MKEATGELNMTVITIVAIGAIVAFFYLFIWPSIRTSLALTSACNAAGRGEYTQETDQGTISCGGGSCTFTDENNKSNTKECGTNTGN